MITRLQAWARLRRLEQLPPPSKMVAVVVPMSSRPNLDDDEQVSLRHLRHHLGKHDIFIIAPENMAVDDLGYPVRRFGDHYFGSGQAHARLQFSAEFYETFIDYKYIFIYHLDSLAFSDQLLDWCGRDFDFIGAPWFPGEATPWVKEPGVGNSGFSLHNVRSFLRVIHSSHFMSHPAEHWREFCRTGSPASLLRMVRRCFFFRNNAGWHMHSWLHLSRRASDTFFSAMACRYLPGFRIAPVADALRFAFETNPRECYQRTQGALPFGCHAWARYDRDFWTPFLLPVTRETARHRADVSTSAR